MNSVELVCELRCRQGEARFDADSLNLVRLKQDLRFESGPVEAFFSMIAFMTNPRRLNPCFVVDAHRAAAVTWFLVIQMLSAALPRCRGEDLRSDARYPEPGIVYTNHRVAAVPWSIHVVRFPRTNLEFEIHSAHAGGSALGLSTLSDQIALLDSRLGGSVAAVNGDFYKRDGPYAGDPRGLQIVDGELVSAPAGGVCFWIDALGQPQATNVLSLFQVTWPNGATSSFGLNQERPSSGVELYTPALGPSTHTTGGRELVLEPLKDSPWLPLRIGRIYKARVREIRETGDTKIDPETMILSMGPALTGNASGISTGSVLTISTASSPSLRGAKTAIGGGPALVRNGKRQKMINPSSESYEVSSMMERHPRTAVGWNEKYIFLVEVDGRQKNLSVGMMLEELSAYLIKLGCDQAMNLDGGGSATLWCNGQVRNSPCDGQERPIANSLIVVRRKTARLQRSNAATAGSPHTP